MSLRQFWLTHLQYHDEVNDTCSVIGSKRIQFTRAPFITKLAVDDKVSDSALSTPCPCRPILSIRKKLTPSIHFIAGRSDNSGCNKLMAVGSTVRMNRFQLLCVFMAVKLKQGSSMPPERCNKCKEGIADPGDSWCTGCSSLELCQTLLKRPWEHPGIRKVAEESILGAARLCKAFSNLDRGLLASAAQGPPGVTPKASGARPRSRSPKRDRRPPLQRAPTPPAPPTRSARREPEDYPAGVSP